MSLPVFLTARAQRDVDDAYDWWARHRSAEQARRWRDECVQAVDSLAEKHLLCGLAPERGEFAFDMRQLNFGLSRRPTHRVVFTVRPEMILELRVQHLAQRRLSPDDI